MQIYREMPIILEEHSECSKDNEVGVFQTSPKLTPGREGSGLSQLVPNRLQATSDVT